MAAALLVDDARQCPGQTRNLVDVLAQSCVGPSDFTQVARRVVGDVNDLPIRIGHAMDPRSVRTGWLLVAESDRATVVILHLDQQTCAWRHLRRCRQCAVEVCQGAAARALKRQQEALSIVVLDGRCRGINVSPASPG